MPVSTLNMGRRCGKRQLQRDSVVLSNNPWEMDDSGYRVLSNRMLVTRCGHSCSICFEDILPNTRVRAQTEVLDGKAMTFYFCPTCCDAMYSNGTSDRSGEILMARYDVGRENAEAKRKAEAA